MTYLNLYVLRREHARLNAEIARQARSRLVDSVRLAELKRRKLALKDRIVALEARTLLAA